MYLLIISLSDLWQYSAQVRFILISCVKAIRLLETILEHTTPVAACYDVSKVSLIDFVSYRTGMGSLFEVF